MPATRIDTDYLGHLGLPMSNVWQSRTGRYVLFESDGTGATGIDAGRLFVRDMVTGETKPAVLTAAGATVDDGHDAMLSEDGRYVLYTSARGDIVAGDTNGVSDVFRFDRQTGTNLLVSHDWQGRLLGGESVGWRMSPDGNVITFVSRANDVVADEDQAHVIDDSVALYKLTVSTGELLKLTSNSADENGYYSIQTPLYVQDVGNNGYLSYLVHVQANSQYYGKTDAYTVFNSDDQLGPLWAVYTDNIGERVNFYDWDMGYMQASWRDASGAFRSAGLGSVDATGQPDGVSNVAVADGGRYLIFTSDWDPIAQAMKPGLFVWDYYASAGGAPVLGKLVTMPLLADANLDSENIGDVSISANGRYVTFRYTPGAGDTTLAAGQYRIENPLWVSGGGGGEEAEAPLKTTEDADIVFGTSIGDTVHAKGGGDIVHGAAGDDILYGDAGDDILLGEIGSDVLYGGADRDTLSGGDGVDSLHGGDGNDSLDGGDGNDTLIGDAGNDTILGGKGNDIIRIDAGDDMIDGGTDDDGKDIDTIVLTGRPSDYLIHDEASTDGPEGHRDGYTEITSQATGHDVLHNVEIARFDALRNNVATVDNVYLTLAQAANTAYETDQRMGDGWAPLTALELGMKTEGSIDAIDTGWTFQNGQYTARAIAPVDLPVGDNYIEAVAQVYFGIVAGKTTVMIAFRGTDSGSDTEDYPAFQLHYQRFAPLVTALLNYIETGGHVQGATIDQVYVTGHSLGGATAQMFMQDARIFGDPRFFGATFGSPGAEHHAYDPRFLHFENSADPVPFAADGARYAQALGDNGLAETLGRFLPGTGGIVATNLGILIDSLVSATHGFTDTNPDPTDFHTSGNVVRMVTDDSISGGPLQHSMTNYLINMANMTANASVLPFMTEGTPGLGGREHVNVVVGGAGAESFTGSEGGVIRQLRGGSYFDGSELFVGGGGADRITGGDGTDIFAGTIADLNGDVITDLSSGEIIRVFGNAIAEQDLVIHAGDGSTQLYIEGSLVTLLGGHSGTFAYRPYVAATVSLPGYTDIVYTGPIQLIGDALDNLLTGGSDDDVLTGGGGADTLRGGDGADVLVGDGAPAASGLRALAVAGDGDDALDGGAGADTMTGGGGRDIFTIDGTARDTITDFATGNSGDVLDLSQALIVRGLGGDAFTTGKLRFAKVGSDSVLLYDADGAAGAGPTQEIALLKNVDSSLVTLANLRGVSALATSVLGPPATASVSFVEDDGAVRVMAGVTARGVTTVAGGSITLTVADPEAGIVLGAGAALRIASTPGGPYLVTDLGTIIGRIGGIGSQTLTVTALTVDTTPAILAQALTAFAVVVPGDAPTAGDFTLMLTLDDGHGTVGSTTQTLHVVAVDDAAVAVADIAATDEGTAITGNVLANDRDVDGPALRIGAVNGAAASVGTAITLVSGARLTLTADGSYVYDPDHAFDTLTAVGSGALNTHASDSFSYTLVGGGTTTVRIDIAGVAGIGDRLAGGAADDVIAGTSAGDVFDLSQGGHDTASGGGGDDGFYFGGALDALDRVDGGAGTGDQLGLQGDYAGARALVMGAQNLVGVETLVLMSGSDTRFGDTAGRLYGYTLTSVDANVAAGDRLVVNMNTLRVGEDVVFDGSAERDGSFLFYGGKGVEQLTGGAGDDGFYFGSGAFGASDRVIGGAGDDDQLGLQGDYTLAFGANQLSGIETIVLLGAGDARFGGGGSGYSYDLTLNDANATGTLKVNANTLATGESLRLDGSAEHDAALTLIGGAGRDTLIGGHIADTLFGGLGADTLTGGAGPDTFVYTGAAQSTGATYDTITDFDAAADVIDLAGSASDYHRIADRSASLSIATLDADLTQALGASLDAHGIGIVTASSGTLAGHSFLVVDVNGTAGYQAGSDILIDLGTAILPPTGLAFVA